MVREGSFLPFALKKVSLLSLVMNARDDGCSWPTAWLILASALTAHSKGWLQSWVME